MRNHRLTGARTALVAGLLLFGVAGDSAADDTVFDFVAPRADQSGNYVPGAGALVSGGIGTLVPIAGWYDEAWRYRLGLSLDNPGAALAEWPMGLVVDADTAAGYHVFHLAQPTGADLRVVLADDALDLMSFGVWDLATNHGRVWFQLPSLASGTTAAWLYFGNPWADPIDLPGAVFGYSTPYPSRYALEPTGSTMVIASMAADNDYATGAATGTLGAGELASIAPADWTTGQAIASTDPIEVGFAFNSAAEGAPASFARTVQSVVVPRGAVAEIRMLAPLQDATVTVSVNGAVVDTVALTAGVATTWSSDLADDAVLRLDSTAPILAAHRSDDNVDGIVLPPPASEVWGFRSGTPRILAVDTATDITVYDATGAVTTTTIAAGAVATLTGSTGSGDGEALRIFATASATGDPAPITVVANGDGDGGDAIVFHPASELGRRWVVPTDSTFVLVALTRPGATCTLTPPDASAPVTKTAPVTPPPPFPQQVKFGANTGVNVLRGSIIDCDAHGFAYHEDQATDDERNLYPMEAHRKIAAADPTATLDATLHTRYSPGGAARIDTPDLIAPTAVLDWSDFRVAASEPTNTVIRYQLSLDQGSTWLMPLDGDWIVAPDPNLGGDADAVRAALPNLDPSTGRLRVRVLLTTNDGVARPAIDAIRVFYSSAGSAERLRWDILPTTIVAGTSVQAAITAIDGDGTTITGISGQVTLSSSHTGQVIPASVSMTGGRAEFSLKLTGAADDVTLRADGPDGLVGISSMFDLVTPEGAALEYVSGSDQFGPVSSLLGEPLVVRVVGSGSTPLGGVQVTFAVTEGAGTFDSGGSSIATITEGDGTARAWLRLGPTPGAQRVRAEGAGGTIEFVARADQPGATAGDEGCCALTERRPPASNLLLALLVGLSLLRRRRC